MRGFAVTGFLLTAAALGFGAGAVGAAEPALSPDYFVETLYPVLEQAQCRQCHNRNGVAARTRLRFPPAGASAADISLFGLALGVLTDRAQPEQSLLLRKPTARTAHTGGERIRRDSGGEQALRNWVRYLAALPEDDIRAALAERRRREGGDGPDGQLRRLTHSQYNNTVRDLLGDETRPADSFPKEDFIHGFRNQSEGQGMSPLLAGAYNQAAERLARNAFRGGDHQRLIPCQPVSPDDAACRDAFTRAFGRRVFRRPLDDAEVRKYGRLFEAGAKPSDDFLEGARLAAEAMLQSPNFLFYSRGFDSGGGGAGERSGFQTASLLSYFLWDTTPDEALLAAAQEGELSSAGGIERAARRMLADPRSRRALGNFLAEWLRFDRMETAVRDRRLYPEFSAELAGAMTGETRGLFDYLVWEDQNFMEFYSADYGFLDASLSRLYGFPEPAPGEKRVRFPAGSQRRGILGQATFLAVTSKPADTSPTERGLFVRQHFLCQSVPPPPPGIDTTLPALSDERPMTTRQRLNVHLSNAACAGCHRLVDPIGFGLEQYDAIGRFRQHQIVTIFPTQDEKRRRVKLKPSEHELEINTAGFVQGLAGSEFSSPKDLGEILAGDPGCQECVVKQLFRYAMGRRETPADRPSIERALRRFENSRFRLQELIIAIVTSRSFLGDP